MATIREPERNNHYEEGKRVKERKDGKMPSRSVNQGNKVGKANLARASYQRVFAGLEKTRERSRDRI